jgi:hypothetical protein
VGQVLGNTGERIGQPSLRVHVVELRRLCRPPNYAEWARMIGSA